MKQIKNNILVILIVSQIPWILLSSAQSSVFNSKQLDRSLVDIVRIVTLPEADQKELRQLDVEYEKQRALCQQQMNLYNQKIAFHHSQSELYTQEYGAQLRLDLAKQFKKVSDIHEKTNQFVFLNHTCFKNILSQREQTLEDRKNRWRLLALEAEIKKLIEQK